MSGIEASRAIRAFTPAPILFLTARTQEQDKQEAYSSGGDDYLAKPFSHAELIMGDGVSFVGFPTTDGTNTSSFQVSSGLAITTSCADKQGAWSFIRSLLTKDAQMGSDMGDFVVTTSTKPIEAGTQVRLVENG